MQLDFKKILIWGWQHHTPLVFRCISAVACAYGKIARTWVGDPLKFSTISPVCGSVIFTKNARSRCNTAAAAVRIGKREKYFIKLISFT
ncbi:hypothetical protein PUN28_017625 [Cardiocondyla obscurior]|uniref:Secreted protein n=1 Tax=Cardiocondyla obscurior TaxID=286306 RepID=A0AAW2EMA2_9HYME